LIAKNDVVKILWKYTLAPHAHSKSPFSCNFLPTDDTVTTDKNRIIRWLFYAERACHMQIRKETIAFLVLTFALLFLYMRHRNNLIQLSYRKQKAENTLTQLTREKEEASNQFLAAQQNNTLRDRAEKELGLTQTSVSQISRLASTQTPQGEAS